MSDVVIERVLQFRVRRLGSCSFLGLVAVLFPGDEVQRQVIGNNLEPASASVEVADDDGLGLVFSHMGIVLSVQRLWSSMNFHHLPLLSCTSS